ncbi:uncharacterized protein [Dermacentor albipictus]|uniref:uncharacterized protein isoform X1 n=2 Tax=Dermacentor albipictus TaxID=60249 RepID=UPI0038FC65FA
MNVSEFSGFPDVEVPLPRPSIFGIKRRPVFTIGLHNYVGRPNGILNFLEMVGGLYLYVLVSAVPGDSKAVRFLSSSAFTFSFNGVCMLVASMSSPECAFYLPRTLYYVAFQGVGAFCYFIGAFSTMQGSQEVPVYSMIGYLVGGLHTVHCVYAYFKVYIQKGDTGCPRTTGRTLPPPSTPALGVSLEDLRRCGYHGSSSRPRIRGLLRRVRRHCQRALQLLGDLGRPSVVLHDGQHGDEIAELPGGHRVHLLLQRHLHARVQLPERHLFLLPAQPFLLRAVQRDGRIHVHLHKRRGCPRIERSRRASRRWSNDRRHPRLSLRLLDVQELLPVKLGPTKASVPTRPVAADVYHRLRWFLCLAAAANKLRSATRTDSVSY